MKHQPLVITRDQVRDIASSVRGAPRTVDGAETLAYHLRDLGFDVVDTATPDVDVAAVVRALLTADPGTGTGTLVAAVRHLYPAGSHDRAIAMHLHDLGLAHGWVPRGQSWWLRTPEVPAS